MLIIDVHSKKNNITENHSEPEIKQIVDQFIEIMDTKVRERKDL